MRIDQMKKINVYRLRYNGNGIDVETEVGTIVAVHPNIVRCQFGTDLDYLLRNTDTSGCFSLSQAEYHDLIKHSRS